MFEQVSWLIGVFGLVYFGAIIAVVAVALIALWRGMKALEAMARQLQAIERAMNQRAI